MVEIMIVLVLVVSIATMSGVQVVKQLAKARVKQAKIMVADMGNSLDMFYTDCGFYPDSLQSLLEPDPNCSNWGPDPYRKKKKIPKDPWGSELMYETDGAEYVLISLGADRREGGDGHNTDISSSDE